MRVKKDWKKYYVHFSTHSPCTIQMKMYDMTNTEMILLFDVYYKDYILILNKIRPTVNEKDLEK